MISDTYLFTFTNPTLGFKRHKQNMIPFIDLLNMKSENHSRQTEIVKGALKEWLLDVENACNKSERSTGTRSTSSKVLKDDESIDPFKIADGTLEVSYQSICTGEVYDLNHSIKAKIGTQCGKLSHDELLPTLRVTKEPIRCQWTVKKMKRCERSFNTAEALTKHVLDEHVNDSEKSEESNTRLCQWGMCKSTLIEWKKHVMEEHLAVHVFGCPFVHCRSTSQGPPKSFSALQEHVQKYHSKNDKMRALFMPLPLNTLKTQSAQAQRLPQSFPPYMLHQSIIRSPKRKKSHSIDNHHIAISQLTPSFSQEREREEVQPWQHKNFLKLQDGVMLSDAYAFDDNCRVGIFNQWTVPLDAAIPQRISTLSIGRPKKQIKLKRGRRK